MNTSTQNENAQATVTDEQAETLITTAACRRLATAVLRQVIVDIKSNKQPKRTRDNIAIQGAKHTARNFIFAAYGERAEARRFWCEAAGIDEKWLQQQVRKMINMRKAGELT